MWLEFLNSNKTEQKIIYVILLFKHFLKYMKRLIGIMGNGDNCVLISQADDSNTQTNLSASVTLSKLQQQQQYVLVLCNSIGTPLESKYIDMQPHYWAMNSSHIVVASKSYFYLWNYQAMVDRNSLKRQTFEKTVFIDNPNASIQVKMDDPSIVSIGSSVQVLIYIYEIRII